MHHDTFQRLLNLIGKTGERIVVTDPEGEKPYVLMSLDHYEKLMSQDRPPATQAPKAPQEAPKPVRRPTLQVAEDLDPPVDLGPARKKREIPLWSPSVPPKPIEKPIPANDGANEANSEEQFYLEPLE